MAPSVEGFKASPEKATPSVVSCPWSVVRKA
jgi:hypothetical protein